MRGLVNAAVLFSSTDDVNPVMESSQTETAFIAGEENSLELSASRKDFAQPIPLQIIIIPLDKPL